jgi:hypothetical protein
MERIAIAMQDEGAGGVCGMRRRHEPRGWRARRAPGRGDFLVSNFHPGAIPGNLVRNDFWR